MVPTPFLVPVWTLFGGAANMTSLLLVLFMRESTQALKRGMRRRNVWELHRRKFLCFLGAGSFFDFMGPVAAWSFTQEEAADVGSTKNMTSMIVFFVFAFATPIVVGAAYIHQVSSLLHK
jgi:hypothetical protein